MKVLKFTLSGRHAMFKKPDVNSYYYFTYGQIHKPALLGILGAVLGYSGYNQMDKSADYPEYYQRLKDIKVSIAPNADKGYFTKKITCFNNSVGYASEEQSGNLIVKEQWLEEPSWDIYVLMNNEEAEKISEHLMNNKSVFVPYLGKNDHIADIKNVMILESSITESANQVNCLVLKEHIQLDVMSDIFADNSFKYEEALPLSLEKTTNQYQMAKFIYTNMELTKIAGEVWCVGDKKIMFY